MSHLLTLGFRSILLRRAHSASVTTTSLDKMFAQALQGVTGGDAVRAHALAAVILAGFDGLALQQLAQPDADLTGAYDLLRGVILAGNPPTP